MNEYSSSMLSAVQTSDILDNAPFAVFVSAADSQELLYLNRSAREIVRTMPDNQVLTCYQVAGFQQPCPFCRTGKMDGKELLTRQYCHPVNKRIYQVSGKMIDWGGRPAHIEYISDITEAQTKEIQTRALSEELQTTFSSIPCGLCVYRYDGKRIYPVFHNQVFYEVMGYSEEHIHLVEQETDYLGVHPEDMAALEEKIHRAIISNGIVQQVYRVWNDQEQQYRWIRLEGSVKPQRDGTKLLYGVYSDVSGQHRMEEELTEAQQEMDHLINSIPGGIASYLIEGKRFIPTFYSDGVLALSGHTRREFDELAGGNALNIVYESDRTRVFAAVRTALESGEVLDVSYRVRRRDGNLTWIHLNGRRMGPLGNTMKFYAVFTGMSAEAQLFQSIANETADGIYVIDRESYDILYVNESKKLFGAAEDCVGKKCYTALHGKQEPCTFCTLKNQKADGRAHEMAVEGKDEFYSTSFRETNWNGIPAYVKYVQNVTDEVQTRREKQRLEQYFETLIRHLPGGVAVMHYKENGRLTPEFLSDGFSAMTGMTPEEAWDLYRFDAMAGVHPDDQEAVCGQIAGFIAGGENQCEIVYRLKKGDGAYLWVKNTLSVIQSGDGEYRLYAGFHDMTRERETQEQLRRQYKELILQHYRTMDPNAIVVGHCNVTQNKIYEIIDHTDSDLLKNFGTVRESFFTGISSLIQEEEERRTFLNMYLNAPALASYEKGDTEQNLTCFIKLPKESVGRYAQFKMSLVETPDTRDVTGILTVTDITEQVISERILRQLSVVSYDLVADVDLLHDSFTLLEGAPAREDTTVCEGRHSDRIAYMLQVQVVPKDREQVSRMLNPAYMEERLKRDGSYSFPYSITGDNGDILTKNLTVSAVDLRLNRICLARTDITESVREEQGLLNVVAYTFELLVFIKTDTGQLTMHTRQSVLENLPPFVIDNYDSAVRQFTENFVLNKDKDTIENQFHLETILKKLEESPAGYDFVLPWRSETGLRYKQVNVLWGDSVHKTVCMVRADVTDMLAAERRTKEALEKALVQAEEANQAKSDFLSSMSHDIRTPMNAIMGMTALAFAHMDEREKLENYLRKISFSSSHLLNLINDILDMSKIERSKITLNHTKIVLPKLMEQLSDMMIPQAEASGLEFTFRTEGILHPCFYGDSLRINQILINILGNALKFTPEGGRVEFAAEEIRPKNNSENVRYRFTISDTGVGMDEEFQAHIFEPFTRNSGTAHVEGSGLGLSITKGLVDLMDGMIAVESHADEGTTFRVELEGEAAETDEHTDDRKEAEPVANEKMLEGRCFLIAEDNDINSEILGELLTMYGAQFVVKKDGIQTVAAFRAALPGTFDAILMDIQMPGMNGYDAARAVRDTNREDAAAIPIIAMTANAFTEDIQAALEAGMNAHIAKPIDVRLLWKTLNSVLNKADEGRTDKSRKE